MSDTFVNEIDMSPERRRELPVNEAAALMASDIQDNLQKYASGSKPEFYAFFLANYEDMVLQPALGFDEKVHRLAFEKLQVATESEIFVEEEGTFITMKVIVDGEPKKLAFNFTEYRNEDDKVYQVAISS